MSQFRDCNVAQLYRTGNTTRRNDAYRYMLRYFARLYTRTNFRTHMDLDTLCCLLDNPAIQATPEQRLDGAIAWVRFEERERRQYLHRLLAQLPGALLSKKRLKELRNDPVACSMQCNINTINDLINCHSRPYYETGTSHGLELTDLSENGGEKVFGFITAGGAAEFEVGVEASPCMTHFKFILTCNRVAVNETSCTRLPECVRADMKVELCAQDGYRAEMVSVDNGSVEEDCVTLVSGARKRPWSRRLHVNQCQMKQFAANDSPFSLFVHLTALEVNGRREEFDTTEEDEYVGPGPVSLCSLQTQGYGCHGRNQHCENHCANSVTTLPVRSVGCDQVSCRNARAYCRKVKRYESRRERCRECHN